MDPVTLIVAALSAGAVALAKEGATDAIKAAYGGLKDFLQKRYPAESVDQLERSPESKARRDVVAEDLAAADAGKDEELLKRAAHLLDIIERHDPESVRVIGVNLRGATGRSLDLADVAARGFGAIGVIAEQIKIDGPIVIKGVRAEGPDTKREGTDTG